MRNLLFLILLLLSFPSVGAQFEYGDIQGEWGAYKKNWVSDDWYQYLKITSDGGSFAYSYGGAPKVLRFDASEIKHLPGMLLIEFQHCEEQRLRLVVSAFRTKRGAALLTGSMFMYQNEGATEVLFNTIHLRMELLQKNEKLTEYFTDLRRDIHN